MKTIYIAFFPDFLFPLREAGRKVFIETIKNHPESISSEYTFYYLGTEKLEVSKNITLLPIKNLKTDNSSVRYKIFTPNYDRRVHQFLTKKCKDDFTEIYFLDGNPFPRNRYIDHIIRKLLLLTCYRNTSIHCLTKFQCDCCFPFRTKIYPLPESLKNHKSQEFSFRPERRILYMGPLLECKGLLHILPAIRLLFERDQDVEFHICQSTNETDQSVLDLMKNLEHDYPKRIVWKGVVDPLDELNKAAVYLYPFNARTMAIPLSIVEAQNAGCHAVISDHHGNRDLFEDDPKIKILSEQQLNSPDYFSETILSVLNEIFR